MSDELGSTWKAVDSMAEDWLGLGDDVLAEVTARCASAGLPAIAVSPCQGRFLQQMARIGGAKRILEIGTLGGYSTIWLARALPPNGKLITMEIDPHHARVARDNLAMAKVHHLVEVREGPALKTLAALEQERADPFDFVFIDADKPNNPRYFEWALRLARPGATVVVDNVVREGAVLDASGTDESTEGARGVLRLMGRSPGIEATVLQTVGSKGYDGFAIAVVGAN